MYIYIDVNISIYGLLHLTGSLYNNTLYCILLWPTSKVWR